MASPDQCRDTLLPGAEVAERSRLRDGCDHPDVTPFGVDGVSIGHASWSGVAYHALSPARALTMDELVSFETLVQALWCYTDAIFRAVQDGYDLQMPDSYSWRFLRAVYSRLATAQRFVARDLQPATETISRRSFVLVRTRCRCARPERLELPTF